MNDKVIGNRDAILAVKDIQLEEVFIPEWQMSVFVKSLTGAERDKFETSVVEQRGNNTSLNLANVRAKLAVLSVCDAEGTRLFKEGDIPALSAKSAGALQRIFIVAQRLSGLGENDVKELTENLEERPFVNSASD